MFALAEPVPMTDLAFLIMLSGGFGVAALVAAVHPKIERFVTSGTQGANGGSKTG
jgi:hypothetical protein